MTDFKLDDCYITATIRCAPPKNKPLPEEIENCRPYFLEELDLLKKVKVIVPFGQIAFTQTLKISETKRILISHPLSFRSWQALFDLCSCRERFQTVPSQDSELSL